MAVSACASADACPITLNACPITLNACPITLKGGDHACLTQLTHQRNRAPRRSAKQKEYVLCDGAAEYFA